MIDKKLTLLAALAGGVTLLMAGCGAKPTFNTIYTSTSTEQAAPTGATTPEEALRTFFFLLNTKQYNQAIRYYSGSYEQLSDWNELVNQNDRSELFKLGCEQNGLQCLAIKSINKPVKTDSNTVHYLVSFAEADGTTFELGPFDEDQKEKPVTEFSFTVKKINGKWFVETMPVYMP